MAKWINGPGYDFEAGCAPGDVLFVVYRQDQNRRDPGKECGQARPGHTNCSGEPRLHGWLGTTNNIYREARGCVEVLRVSKRDQTRIQVRPLADADPRVKALAEEFGIKL